MQVKTCHRVSHLVAGVVLSSLAGLAHAESDHQFQGAWWAIGALFILLGQAIYLLCLPRTKAGLKIMLVFALAAVDTLAGMFVLSVFSTSSNSAETPIVCALLVIPGFIFIYLIRTRMKRPPATGPQ